MPGSYQIMIDGKASGADLYTAIASIEVEESMDMPAALQLSLPVTRDAQGTLSYVDDARFAPFSNIAIVTSTGAGATAGAAGAAASLLGAASASTSQCIFDGYVLSQRLHLDSGVTQSNLEVWGQDASWLMNMTEHTKDWIDASDGAVANAIFGDYGITPSDQNLQDDSPVHAEAAHSLMQRASDIQFLRNLARRNGKVCRIACADQPGVRTGYFARPRLDGDPAVTLTLNAQEEWTVRALSLSWDATRATSVVARQASFDDASTDGISADTADSGLPLLGKRDLQSFTGKPMQVVLTTVVDDAGELSLRAQALLRDALWFVRCEGDTDVERLHAVLRAGMIVALEGLGTTYSGKYLVWSVRHLIKPDSHTMKFVLLSNSIGTSAPSGAALPLSL